MASFASHSPNAGALALDYLIIILCVLSIKHRSIVGWLAMTYAPAARTFTQYKCEKNPISKPAPNPDEYISITNRRRLRSPRPKRCDNKNETFKLLSVQLHNDYRFAVRSMPFSFGTRNQLRPSFLLKARFNTSTSAGRVLRGTATRNRMKTQIINFVAQFQTINSNISRTFYCFLRERALVRA